MMKMVLIHDSGRVALDAEMERIREKLLMRFLSALQRQAVRPSCRVYPPRPRDAKESA